MNAEETAIKSLTGSANKKVVKAVKKAVLDGTHEWTWDPQHSKVVGLVQVGTNKADVVVYLADGTPFDDFEITHEFGEKAGI